PFLCKFCTTPASNNGLWRPRPVENIITELKMISQNRRISDIFFVDDNITADTKRFEKLCERIIECKKNNEITDFKFNSQIRLDIMLKSPQLVKKMAAAGFWMICTGIESIREKTQKNLRKGLAFNKVLKALEILHKHNIIVAGNMIIGGDLNSTEKEIREDIKFLHKVDIEFLPFSLMTPFPGSLILKELEEKNLVITKDWSKYTILTPVIKTYKLSPEKLHKLLIYSYKELKYLNHPGRMIRRVIKTRGIMFALNPIRFLSLVISYLKMKLFYKKIY
ncbi:MAG: radical SAM protein, partial [Candidatus Lokiarchaeota archaeon]|nr:radical SAM protein [Candidatus Lokiarchaeota archaeon]